jgi:hypothetical protein
MPLSLSHCVGIYYFATQRCRHLYNQLRCNGYILCGCHHVRLLSYEFLIGMLCHHIYPLDVHV